MRFAIHCEREAASGNTRRSPCAAPFLLSHFPSSPFPSTIWADNLLFANGLLLWQDGAIVTMAPKIVHLRDTKSAGKANREDILYVGFAAQNPQLRVSHPILGLDGWIYCANGLRGGKV